MLVAGTVVTNPFELELRHAAWSDLLERSSTNEPTLSPEWVLAWWRVFGGQGGRALRVVALYSGDRLIGLAPLLARRYWYRPGIPFRRIEALGSGEDEHDEIVSEYLSVIAERGAEDAAAEALAGMLDGGALGAWDELVLPAMDGAGAVPSALVGALRRRGIAASLEVTGTASYVPLPASFAAYLDALPSSGRYLVRRSLRDFDAWAGERSKLYVASTRGELEEGKRALRALHADRWEGHGAFRSERFQAFHDAVMPALLARGALELMWLTVNGAPIAALYNIVWNGKVHFYQGGRRVDVPKSIRPGIVLHARAIQRSIELGRREYDLLGGVARYKQKLALATRPLVTLRAVRAPVLEAARGLAEDGFARARRVRSSLSPWADRLLGDADVPAVRRLLSTLRGEPADLEDASEDA